MFIHFLVCTCFSFCCSCFGNRFIVVNSSVLLIFSMLFFPTICYVTIFSSKEEYEFLPHFACILELAQFKIGICNPPFSDEITQLYIKALFFSFQLFYIINLLLLLLLPYSLLDLPCRSDFLCYYYIDELISAAVTCQSLPTWIENVFILVNLLELFLTFS